MKKLIAGFAAMAFTVVATVALAQTPAPPANDPIKRTPLQKTEYPEGHFTYVMMVEIAPNATVGRHTHPASRAATSSTAISIS
jgi:quercetin dioxygenase-like cupin family protein